MPDGDPRLRLRIWIDREQADEVWIDVSNPDSQELLDRIQVRHEAMVDAANEAGSTWMIEVYDPELPADRAYFRFGSDRRAMVMPIVVIPLPGDG
jgi:hypothetical protein